MKKEKRGLMTILVLLTITGGLLAHRGVSETKTINPPQHGEGKNGGISVSTALTQDKVLIGGDGMISLALTLSSEEIFIDPEHIAQPVDVVVVLDKSGSMRGPKIGDAKRALTRLVDMMSPRDRIAIVTYSNHAQLVSGLLPASETNKNLLRNRIAYIQEGGGTNLGGGLERGIDLLLSNHQQDRQRTVLLISDGLANQGITHPTALGAMASRASEHNLTISTIGVGYDFNEVLMTTIADHGAGNYHFLEEPQAIAGIFAKEFETARRVAASSVELHIPLDGELKLVSAGGYPFSIHKNIAVIKPGNLMNGQTRQIFLTYQVPAKKQTIYPLGTPWIEFQQNGEQKTAAAPDRLEIGCVKDEQEVIASYDEGIWSEHVVKEEYSRLKEDVATAVRAGKKDTAMKAIQDYEQRNKTLNKALKSERVSSNLAAEVGELKEKVQATFTGAPAAVAEQQKQQAKALQYESYRVRRDKK